MMPEIEFARDAYGDFMDEVDAILSTAPTVSLAAVKAEALREAADAFAPGIVPNAGNGPVRGVQDTRNWLRDRAAALVGNPEGKQTDD